MNIQFLFNYNYNFICFFFCFTIIFIIIFFLLISLAGRNNLNENKFLIAPFAYILSVSAYKYGLFVFNDNFTKWQIFVYLDFILGSLSILIILNDIYYIEYLLISRILLLISYSNVDYFPFSFACICFISIIFSILYASIKISGDKF